MRPCLRELAGWWLAKCGDWYVSRCWQPLLWMRTHAAGQCAPQFCGPGQLSHNRCWRSVRRVALKLKEGSRGIANV